MVNRAIANRSYNLFLLRHDADHKYIACPTTVEEVLPLLRLEDAVLFRLMVKSFKGHDTFDIHNN